LPSKRSDVPSKSESYRPNFNESGRQREPQRITRTELVGPLKAKRSETTSRKLVGRLRNVSDAPTSSKAYIDKDDPSSQIRRTLSFIFTVRTVLQSLRRPESESCSLGLE
jgi:hypothetical protein